MAEGARKTPGLRLPAEAAEIDKDIFTPLPRTRRPTFDTNTKVTMEEVLEVATTAPSVIGLDVAVIFPLVSCKNVSAPKAHVKLIIRVPLRARWRRDLLYLLSRIGLTTGKGDRIDRGDTQQGRH